MEQIYLAKRTWELSKLTGFLRQAPELQSYNYDRNTKRRARKQGV